MAPRANLRAEHHTIRGADPRRRAHRGAVLHFRGDPGDHDSPDAFEYWDDGLLIVAHGRIEAVGPAEALMSSVRPAEIVDHAGGLLLPGFVDTHIHFPQTDMIASGGRNLLEWLEQYTFPEERRFASATHAREVAEFFCAELLANGTTTAQVFGTVHRTAIEEFFAVAESRNLRMIGGKVLMDCNGPADLRDTAIDGERDCRELIDAWHGRGRLLYAITPRFAATSSQAQLAAAGRVARDHPDVLIHSHLAENLAEIAWVRRLFPEARSYLDVYDRHGLLRERSVYAHCIHLDSQDRHRMAQAGAAAAFCPTSNLYLGSGLFDIAATDAAGMKFSLATDVGGGTSFSMIRTMGEAYKVAQLREQRLSPLRAFYLATLGGALALGLQDKIGHFAPGVEADFVVLDFHATPLLARRAARVRTLSERLLLMMTLGDDRAVAATYILGEQVPSAATRAI